MTQIKIDAIAVIDKFKLDNPDMVEALGDFLDQEIRLMLSCIKTKRGFIISIQNQEYHLKIEELFGLLESIQ